jgi:uncharacterized protein
VPKPRTLSIARGFILLYLSALAAAEVVIAFVSVQSGLIVEAVILAALVNHYTFSPQSDERVRHALVVLALIPLARLASFMLPQAALSSVYWEALVLVPILLGITLTSELVDPKWLKLSRGRSPPWIQGVVALTGIPLSLGLVQWGLEGPIDQQQSASLLGQAVVVFFTSGITAEILFRGLVQSALTGIFGRVGVGLTSVAFASSFLGTGSTAYVVFAGALGLGYGIIVERTGSVVGVGIAHGVVNVGWNVVWPRLL